MYVDNSIYFYETFNVSIFDIACLFLTSVLERLYWSLFSV